jgi:hypothetical protein
MQLKKFATRATVAIALSTPAVAAFAVPVSGVAQAAPVPAAMAHMTVTKMGTFEKLLSMSSFTFKVGMKTYTVKVNAMTHITHNGMKEKLSALKKGQSLTVKGTLEMATIMASSVTVGM